MRPIPALVTVQIALIALSIPGCAEHLPPYAPPKVSFEARIIASDVLIDDLEGGAGTPAVEFAVDVTNIYDQYNQYKIDPPFDIRVDVTVFVEQDPTRKREVEGTERVVEIFGPGTTVRIIMPLPSRDQNGYPWCWEYGESVKRELVLQGKVRIPRVDGEDIVVNTPRKIIQYYVPSTD